MKKCIALIICLMTLPGIAALSQSGNPYLLKDINPGTAGSNVISGDPLNGLYYFSAESAVYGYEIWVTDFTTNGTYMLKDINSGSGSGVYYSPHLCGSLLFFGGDDGSTGIEPWISDGSANGTNLLKEIMPKKGSINQGSLPRFYTYMSGVTYFSAAASMSTYSMTSARYFLSNLYRSDGTANGTYALRNINPTAKQSTNPRNLTPVNTILYFSAEQGSVDGSGT